MGFSFSHSGDFERTMAWLERLQKMDISTLIRSQAQKGVAALAAATPMESGRAKASWGFEIKKTSNSVTIFWTNSDVENGFPVAVMIQYGHGTGTGGYIQGIDYINPALRPIFQEIADTVWKAVTSR